MKPARAGRGSTTGCRLEIVVRDVRSGYLIATASIRVKVSISSISDSSARQLL